MKKPSNSSTPFAELTNNLTPFSSLRKLCKLPKSGVGRKENRGVSNSVVSESSIGSSSFSNNGGVAKYRIAPPTTPPLGEAGSGEHSYNRRLSDVTPAVASLKTCKDKGKAIAVTPVRPTCLKTVNNKGIVIVDPSDETRSKDKATSSAFDKLKVKGIEIRKPSVTFSSSHLTRDNDKRKASPRKSRDSSIQNDIKGTLKKTAAPCDGLFSEMKNKDALPTPLNLSSTKELHKENSYDMPSPFKTNENLVKEMEVFTCPPLPRTRSTRKRTTKAEGTKPPKSWTDPHPKKPKTRRVKMEADNLDFLPKEFVEKHRAYFKEIDEFELQEEEVSGNDSD